MEFRTENGTQIPISGLDDSLAITVAINNGSGGAETGAEGSGAGGVPAAGAVNISHCDSAIVRVSTGNTNRQAGLFVQLNFTSLEGELGKNQHHKSHYTGFVNYTTPLVMWACNMVLKVVWKVVLWFYTLLLFPSFLSSPPSDVSQKDKSRQDADEPYITAYLHTHERPNEFNCTDKKRISLSMTRGPDLDHRKYTFFLSPE